MLWRRSVRRFYRAHLISCWRILAGPGASTYPWLGRLAVAGKMLVGIGPRRWLRELRRRHQSRREAG